MLYQTSETLHRIIQPFQSMERRDLFPALCDFVSSPPSPRIACLYGLRRTGKTVLGLHALSEANDFENSAYILCQSGDSMNDIYSLLHENEMLCPIKVLV